MTAQNSHDARLMAPHAICLNQAAKFSMNRHGTDTYFVNELCARVPPKTKQQ